MSEPTKEERKLSPSLLDTYKAWHDTHSQGMKDYHGYERGTMWRRHLAFMDTVGQLPDGETKDKLTAAFKDVCMLLMLATESPRNKMKILKRHRLDRAVKITKAKVI